MNNQTHDDLRKSAGFYDGNENKFEAAPTLARDIPDDLIETKTWIYDHLNASIVGIDKAKLTNTQLRDLLTQKVGKPAMVVYHDNIHWVSEKEMMENRGRHWGPVHVITMTIDALAKQIQQFHANSRNYY